MALRPVYRILKIAKELRQIRDNLLAGSEYSFHVFEHYTILQQKQSAFAGIQFSILALLFSVERRHILEKSHLLYHRLSEIAGYPVSEKQFLSIRGDNLIKFSIVNTVMR